MEPIILLKDNSTKVFKKSSKFQLYLKENFDNCKYLLIPINDINHTFVLIKPKKYMIDFYKAKISYQLLITDYHTFDDSEESKELSSVNIETYSITELITTLHSLNRIRYYNKVANSNESHVFALYEFINFKLEVVCEQDKLHTTMFDEKITGSIQCRFNVHEIFELVKPIYNPISKFPKNNECLIISDNIWYLSKNVSQKINDIIGIILPCTKSLTFITNTVYFKMITCLNSVFCSALTYNPNYMSEIVSNESALFDNEGHDDIRYHDLWTHNMCDIIEYVNYAQYITMASILASEMIAYNETKNKMIMRISLVLTVYSMDGRKEIPYEFDDNALTLSKFYDIIMNLDV